MRCYFSPATVRPIEPVKRLTVDRGWTGPVTGRIWPIATLPRKEVTGLPFERAVLGAGRTALLLTPLQPDDGLTADVIGAADILIADSIDWARPGFAEAVKPEGDQGTTARRLDDPRRRHLARPLRTSHRLHDLVGTRRSRARRRVRASLWDPGGARLWGNRVLEQRHRLDGRAVRTLRSDEARRGVPVQRFRAGRPLARCDGSTSRIPSTTRNCGPIGQRRSRWAADR